jgi:hypothetical protein
MIQLRTPSKLLLALLCMLLVVMRVSGAHMHLCLDGSEPPTTLHMDHGADEHHQGDHDGQLHSDVDVSLSSDTLVKSLSSHDDAPVLLTLIFVFGAAFLARLCGIYFDSLPPLHSQFAFIRPPLRGPPR